MMALRTLLNYDVDLDVVSNDADEIQLFLLLEVERNQNFVPYIYLEMVESVQQ